MKDIQIHTLGYYVDRTFTNMVKFLNYELTSAGLDLQHPQFAIMMVLASNEGITQTQLTEFVDRDKSSVSRNIKYLEERGYIERTGESRKKKFLYLTEKGRKIMPLLYEISDKDTVNTLQGFSDKKRKEIYEILTKMFLNVSSSIGSKESK